MRLYALYVCNKKRQDKNCQYSHYFITPYQMLSFFKSESQSSKTIYLTTCRQKLSLFSKRICNRQASVSQLGKQIELTMSTELYFTYSKSFDPDRI